MKTISKITLGITVASAIFISGCNSTDASKPIVAKASISEESLGLRKTDLYTESTTTGDKTMYGTGYAGSGYKIKRAFQDAPPMIPHDTEGMLPITFVFLFIYIICFTGQCFLQPKINLALV